MKRLCLWDYSTENTNKRSDFRGYATYADRKRAMAQLERQARALGCSVYLMPYRDTNADFALHFYFHHRGYAEVMAHRSHAPSVDPDCHICQLEARQ